MQPTLHLLLLGMTPSYKVVLPSYPGRHKLTIELNNQNRVANQSYFLTKQSKFSIQTIIIFTGVTIFWGLPQVICSPEGLAGTLVFTHLPLPRHIQYTPGAFVSWDVGKRSPTNLSCFFYHAGLQGGFLGPWSSPL